MIPTRHTLTDRPLLYVEKNFGSTFPELFIYFFLVDLAMFFILVNTVCVCSGYIHLTHPVREFSWTYKSDLHLAALMQPGDECDVDRRRLTAKNPPHPRRDYPRFYLFILPFEPDCRYLFVWKRRHVSAPPPYCHCANLSSRYAALPYWTTELCGWKGDREQTFLFCWSCPVLFLNDARWRERLHRYFDMQISPWHPCLMEFVMKMIQTTIVSGITSRSDRTRWNQFWISRWDWQLELARNYEKLNRNWMVFFLSVFRFNSFNKFDRNHFQFS